MKNEDESLYIVMPAYNEQDNIEAVVKSWYEVLAGKSDDSKLVVADSGSTDDTHRKLLALQTDMPKLEILDDTDKQHGPKLLALYRYAITQNAGWIFQTDSDGQTDPAEFTEFWNIRESMMQYSAIVYRVVTAGRGLSWNTWSVCCCDSTLE